MKPLRQVVRSEFWQSNYSKKGQGSNRLFLDCGHNVFQKASIRIPKQKRCPYCPTPGL